MIEQFEPRSPRQKSVSHSLGPARAIFASPSKPRMGLAIQMDSQPGKKGHFSDYAGSYGNWFCPRPSSRDGWRTRSEALSHTPGLSVVDCERFAFLCSHLPRTCVCGGGVLCTFSPGPQLLLLRARALLVSKYTHEREPVRRPGQTSFGIVKFIAMCAPGRKEGPKNHFLPKKHRICAIPPRERARVLCKGKRAAPELIVKEERERRKARPRTRKSVRGDTAYAGVNKTVRSRSTHTHVYMWTCLHLHSSLSLSPAP